jgi:hypothetical protein
MSNAERTNCLAQLRALIKARPDRLFQHETQTAQCGISIDLAIIIEIGKFKKDAANS